MSHLQNSWKCLVFYQTETAKPKKRTNRNISLYIRQLITDREAMKGKITQSEADRRYRMSTLTVSYTLDIWCTERRMEKKKREVEGKRSWSLRLCMASTQVLNTTIKERLKAEFPDFAAK